MLSKIEKDGIKVNDSQVEAMVSLADNVGENALYKSEGWKDLKQGDIETAEIEFFDENRGFVRQGKKKLAGLVRRRAAERDLFSSV